MNDIPKSVKIAISAASRDVVESMRSSGVLPAGDISKLASTIDRFVSGMVLQKYAKTKSAWVSEEVDPWLIKSAAAEHEGILNDLAERIKNSPEITKEVLIESTKSHKSMAAAEMAKYMADPEKFKRDNPDIASIIEEAMSGSKSVEGPSTEAPAAPAGPTPAAPSKGGILDKMIAEDVSKKGLDALPPLSDHKSPEPTAEPTEENPAKLSPINPAQFMLGRRKQDKPQTGHQGKPVDIVENVDEFSGTRGVVSGEPKGV